MNLSQDSKKNNSITKTCKDCKETKPVEGFIKVANTNYYASYCRLCSYQRKKQYGYKNTKEKLVPSLEGEVWKSVFGYEELYEVSNHGRLKTLYYSKPQGRPCLQVKRSERIMKQTLSSKGYYKVTLTKEKKQGVIHVHLIVWDAFGDSKRNGHIMVVDHKDNNPKNNNLCNLQCITQRLNASKDRVRKHSKYLGVYKHSNKPKSWESKITINGQYKRLGLFYTEEEASEAYQKALSKILTVVGQG